MASCSSRLILKVYHAPVSDGAEPLSYADVFWVFPKTIQSLDIIKRRYLRKIVVAGERERQLALETYLWLDERLCDRDQKDLLALELATRTVVG